MRIIAFSRARNAFEARALPWRCYRGATATGRTGRVSCRDYLGLLMVEEVAHGTQTRIQRCVRRAHFPFLETIEEVDFIFQAQARAVTTTGIFRA